MFHTAGQDTTGRDEDRMERGQGTFSAQVRHHYFGSHSLKVAELDTRVSACLIRPINKCTFCGITFHLKILGSSF